MRKKIIITVALVFVLLIGFVVAAPFIFKDKLLQIAKAEINKQVNAQVDFKDVGISIFRDFPHLTLSLNQLSVVNNEPFKGDTLAAAGAVSASVNILSLLKGGAIEVRGIFIDKPEVNVRVQKDGTANYNIMKETVEEKKGTEPTEYKIGLKQLKITGGNITYNDKQSDISATLANLNFKMSGDFTQDVFDIKSLTEIAQATVNSGGVGYLNNANIELKLDVNADMPNATYTFKDNNIRVNAMALALDGWLSNKTKDSYDMDLKFAAKETSFKNLLSLVPAIYLKDFEKIKTSGNLALSGYAKGAYEGETYPAFGVTLKVDDAMFQYPDLPAAVTGIFIDLKANSPGGDLDKTVIDIPRFDLKAGSEPVAMRIHIETPVSDPDIDLNATGKLNLANVKQFYPLGAGEELAGNVEADASMQGRLSALENEQYDKVKASGTVNISGLKYKSKDLPEGVAAEKIYVLFASKTGAAKSSLRVNGYGKLDVRNLKYSDSSLPGGKVDISNFNVTLNESDAQLERLNAKVGKSDFNLSGKLDNLLGYLLRDGALSGNLNLNSTLLDLNEWMTTGSPSETASKEKPAETSASESAEIPANLSVDFSANAARVLFDKVEMKNVTAKASIRNEAFTLQSLFAEMLGGTTSMNGSYSTKEVTPKVDFGYNIQNINIMQAVNSMPNTEKLAPVFKYMNGKFSSNGSMKGSLLSDLSLDLPSLLANGKVTINNGVISGFPILQNLADKFKIEHLKTVNLSDAWTVFEVKNGRVAVEPFDIKFNNMAMNIAGSQGLDQTIDYDIIMDLPKNLMGGATELVSGLLAKSPIPGFSASALPDITKFKVKVTNTLTDPKLEVKLLGGEGASIKEQITETVKEQVQQVKEDYGPQARAQADKILAEAKVQAQKIRDEGKKLADTVKKEGYAQAKKLEEQAKNPLAKIAAQEAAKKLRKESDDKSNRIVKEANEKATKLEQEAQKQANQILQKAGL